MSDNLKDILAYAWNGKQDELATALDAEMQARVADRIGDMTAEVSAGLFGQAQEDSVAPPSEQEDLETEGTTEDENV